MRCRQEQLWRDSRCQDKIVGDGMVGDLPEKNNCGDVPRDGWRGAEKNVVELDGNIVMC